MFIYKKTVRVILTMIHSISSAFLSTAQSHTAYLIETNDHLQYSTAEYRTLKSITEPSEANMTKDNHLESY